MTNQPFKGRIDDVSDEVKIPDDVAGLVTYGDVKFGKLDPSATKNSPHAPITKKNARESRPSLQSERLYNHSTWSSIFS